MVIAEVETGVNPVIEVDNLTVEFPADGRHFIAVENVSMTLNPGETHCVVGESGSGKSVTARSILQIVDKPGRITSGSVIYRSANADGTVADAIDILRIKPHSRAMRSIRGSHIAMIFQEPMTSLSPVHRIGVQIGEALRLHRNLSRREAKARSVELLAQVGIRNPGKAVDQYPFEFSGGMRQRAMIAIALSCNPSVLIADEPTTALDVTIQAEILDLIGELQKSYKMAVMFITHDMGIVANIADRITVMRNGRVLESGPADATLGQPQHAYTRELIQAARDLDRPSPTRLSMRARNPVGKTIIDLKKVSKDFIIGRSILGRPSDITNALKETSIQLRVGENLGIVGESGSGKTTLARCVQRVYELSSGEILFYTGDSESVDLAPLGEVLLRPYWRQIRTIFQDPHSSLNPRMTVGEIIAEPLRQNPHGPRGAALRDRVVELLELVELPATASSRYPHSFSGGQRQRIAIARAIGPQPRVILADEPTSALDVALRTTILDLLLALQDRLSLSFVFVSHDIAVIRYFCDRIAVMRDGEIVETGETETICSAPQHPYTQLLLSAVLKV